MNNVSFLFYLADIITNFKPVAAFLAIFCFVLGGMPFIVSLFGEIKSIDVYYKKDSKTYERTEVTATEYKSLSYHERWDEKDEIYVRYLPNAKVWAWLTVPLAVFMMLFANLLPSRDTIFMIATSEFVEDFSQTEAGTEIGTLAKETLEYLKNELAKLKGE